MRPNEKRPVAEFVARIREVRREAGSLDGLSVHLERARERFGTAEQALLQVHEHEPAASRFSSPTAAPFISITTQPSTCSRTNSSG